VVDSQRSIVDESMGVFLGIRLGTVNGFRLGIVDGFLTILKERHD